MHRIDGAGNVAGMFADLDPSEAVEGTVLTADWANTLQEELVAVVEDGGGTLSKPNNHQVRDALRATYVRRRTPSYTDATAFISDTSQKPAIVGVQSWWSSSAASYTIGGQINASAEETIAAVEILAQNTGTTSVSISTIFVTSKDASGVGWPAINTSINFNSVSGASIALPASGALAWWTVPLSAGTHVVPASGYLYASMELLIASAVDKLRVYAVRIRYA